MTTVERLDLQAQVAQATAEYQRRWALVEEARAVLGALVDTFGEKKAWAMFEDILEQLEFSAEIAWLGLVDARWDLARAQGLDPLTICFQEA